MAQAQIRHNRFLSIEDAFHVMDRVEADAVNMSNCERGVGAPERRSTKQIVHGVDGN